MPTQNIVKAGNAFTTNPEDDDPRKDPNTGGPPAGTPVKQVPEDAPKGPLNVI